MTVSPEEAAEILELLSSLDSFLLRKSQASGSVAEGTTLDTPLRYKLRTALYQNLDWFDEYLSENPDRLLGEQLELILSWKAAKRGRFTLAHGLKKGAVLNDGKLYYLVLGLQSSLVELTEGFGFKIPAFIETTLLPYRGRIVYDGLLGPLPIHFGGGARRNIKEDYAAASRSGRINTSLDGQSSLTPPHSAPGDAHLREELGPTLKSLVKTVEKLRGRGSTGLQSPALTLLRWSAQLAATSLEEKPDRESLRKQLSQLRRSLTQVTNALIEGDF